MVRVFLTLAIQQVEPIRFKGRFSANENEEKEIGELGKSHARTHNQLGIVFSRRQTNEMQMGNMACACESTHTHTLIEKIFGELIAIT